MGLIGRVWAEIGGDASGLKKAAQEGKDALKSIGSEAQSASSKSTSSLAGFATQAALVIGGLTAALKVARETFDLAAEGAQIASLEQASMRLATTYGTSMTDIVNAVQKASFYTITDYDAMKAANLAMTMGISTNATEIAQLMQIAIERGRAFGLTTEDAFDRITRGIGRRSTKILDDLGFTANAIQANKEYAASLGISTSELTDDMKVRALFNNVLREGNAELEKQGGLVMDVSTPYQRVATNISQAGQNLKKALAYGFLGLFASPQEVAQINQQRLQTALAAKDYEEYVSATIALAEAQGKQAWQYHVLSKQQFEDSQFALGQAIVMKQKTTETAESISFLNEEMALEIGLSNQLAEAQDKYATAMSKAGNSTEKQRTAISDLRNTYESFVLETVQSLGADTSATMSLAYAFGDIDKTSLGLFSVLEQLTSMAEDGSIGWDQWAKYVEKATSNAENLAKLQIGDKHATFTVDFVINYITRGTPLSRLTFSGIPTNEELGISLQNKITKKHGGSFVGLAHGGIVPPGYSNDGMPIWVSSGERVDVTPAGNKSVDNEQIAYLISDLKHAVELLPVYIRDAVQMA